MRRVCLALPLCLGIACLPEPQPLTFEPVDRDALQAQLDDPTGLVTEESAAEVARILVRDGPALNALLLFIDGVFEEEEGEEGDELFRLQGTNVYARVACPGVDLANPDTSFDSGQLRIDSPTLTEEIIENLALEGDMWLDLDACRIASFEFREAFALHYAREDLRATIDLDLVYVDHAVDPEEDRAVHYPMVFDLDEGYQMLVTLESGDTVVLEVLFEASMVSLRGSNGTFACTLDADAVDLECAPP